MYFYVLVSVSMKLYEVSFPEYFPFFCQHAHIENIKDVANLTNNKDVFMCILHFHARAGYLHTYATLLKEINNYPGSEGADTVTLDQYAVESVALADRNLNVPCHGESGIRYPSLVAMLNSEQMLWLPKVI